MLHQHFFYHTTGLVVLVENFHSVVLVFLLKDLSISVCGVTVRLHPSVLIVEWQVTPNKNIPDAYLIIFIETCVVTVTLLIAKHSKANSEEFVLWCKNQKWILNVRAGRKLLPTSIPVRWLMLVPQKETWQNQPAWKNVFVLMFVFLWRMITLTAGAKTFNHKYKYLCVCVFVLVFVTYLGPFLAYTPIMWRPIVLKNMVLVFLLFII